MILNEVLQNGQFIPKCSPILKKQYNEKIEYLNSEILKHKKIIADLRIEIDKIKNAM